MKKILSIRKRGQITLPKDLLEKMKVEDGDVLEFNIDEEGNVTVIPMTLVPTTWDNFIEYKKIKNQENVKEDQQENNED
jgi:bifunctional DNA-binding transcriptional regulator/antitoxin component of YhaV-PrlF toxin-antitoxin module